jgi:hypothetical protein
MNEPDQEQEYQWEVTDHWPNEELIKALFNRFDIAFAFSQPNQDENADWRYTQCADIEGRFAAGENTVRVAWSDINPEQTYVTIRRL